MGSGVKVDTINLSGGKKRPQERLVVRRRPVVSLSLGSRHQTSLSAEKGDPQGHGSGRSNFLTGLRKAEPGALGGGKYE